MSEEPEEELELRHVIGIEKARRDIEQAIEDGIVTREEIINAPIIEVTQMCDCDNFEPNDQYRCTQCYTKCKVEDVTNGDIDHA